MSNESIFEKLEVINVSPECKIITTRIFNFPIEKVYNAWTNPDQLKKWWGPKWFTNTFNKFELIPGGNWSFIMHWPNNVDYPNECRFIEIKSNESIIWNHISNPQFQIEVSFIEQESNSTKVVFKMKFWSEQECNIIKTFAVEKNEENMDRLEELLKNIL